jgi:hypothetical protein
MGNRAVSFDSADYLAKHALGTQGNSSGAKFEVRKHSPGLTKRKRSHSSDSINDRVDDYGWFEDFEANEGLPRNYSGEFTKQPLQKALSLPASVTEPPLYVLESNLETQHLWYATAGRRPKQPQQEREYYEKLWNKNFENSSVKYHANSVTSNDQVHDNDDSPAKKKTKNHADVIPKHELRGEVLFRGKSPFSNSVSKSFMEDSICSVTLQMPYYRIFCNLEGDIHAEYLIKVTLGGNAPVTFGIWKRHSDFAKLAEVILQLNIRSGESNSFKNALLSWQCVLQRKKWFRSLDKDYLALKCFLLERFMHDVLFEAQMPGLINKFLGLED